MTWSATVNGGEREENRALHRYSTDGMADSCEIPLREVHRCGMCRAAQQKMHRAFGKQFRPGFTKDAVMEDVMNTTICAKARGISPYLQSPKTRR